MKIYTKTGDEGKTSRYDGSRVSKDDSVIVGVAKIDSLLGSLDYAFISIDDKEIKDIIERIQDKLWQAAGEISLGGSGKKVDHSITKENIEELEEYIDNFHDEKHSFVRFRTTEACAFNEARLRARDAEVALTPLLKSNQIRSEIYKYINRLSDLLFVLACHTQKTYK